MGCDIHSYAEANYDGRWIQVRNPDSGAGERIFSRRDYILFSFLNDVRNAKYFVREPSFAWGNGLPTYLSSGIARRYRKYELDAHSETHFTLEQALNVDLIEIAIKEEYSKEFLLDTGQDENTLRDITYAELLEGTVWFEAIGKLKQFADDRNIKYSNVRIVMWFDN